MGDLIVCLLVGAPFALIAAIGVFTLAAIASMFFIPDGWVLPITCAASAAAFVVGFYTTAKQL